MARQPKSLKGSLLLDGGSLQGSYFHRTVVLICQHDAKGAFGLVLNKPTEGLVGEALPGDLPQALKEHRLFSGGPVQPQALSYLHSDFGLSDGNVMKDVQLGHSLDELVELAGSASLTLRLLVCAGYSGWGPGQLDEELSRGAWLTRPASTSLIFSNKPEQLWRSIVAKKGWQYRLMSDGPDDLSVN